VERERSAQGGPHRARERLGRAPDRAGPAVGVGHPGVVVDVAARIRRHERVARRPRVRDGVRRGGRALERREGGPQRVDDRVGGRGRGEREHKYGHGG
jgi:hypothetical protein